MRVLIVEDERRMARHISQALIEQSCAVDVAHDGLRALELTDACEYDAIVLDLMLPGVDGLTVCRRLRQKGSPAAVLILSARDLVEDRVTGLEAGAFRSPAFPRVGWAAERQAAAAARERVPLITLEDSSRGRERLATVVIPRPGAEALVLQLTRSTAPVERTLQELAGVMAIALVFVLVVATYGSRVTARRALAPVDEIVTRVRTIQATELGARLEVSAQSDEIDRLVSTLNEMLDRIEASMRSARRFAADASHELQTPLAAMHAALEACVQGTRAPADYRAAAGDLLVDVNRMSLLVRDLRLLALADAGRLIVPPEPVDVAVVVDECAEIARAIGEPRQVGVSVTTDGEPRVSGSALHLRRAILNVAHNAVRYSPPGVNVRIEAGTRDGEAIVTVADQGCGIGPDDLPHIFEPFYRADPARARETGGSGLGLAIAEQVVRAHGGRIHVSSTLGAGSTFTIRIPALAND